MEDSRLVTSVAELSKSPSERESKSRMRLGDIFRSMPFAIVEFSALAAVIFGTRFAGNFIASLQAIDPLASPNQKLMSVFFVGLTITVMLFLRVRNRSVQVAVLLDVPSGFRYSRLA